MDDAQRGHTARLLLGRSRLFVLSAGLILLVGLINALVLDSSLGDWITGRSEGELLRLARGCRASLLSGPADAVRGEALHRQVSELAEAIGARLTLIGAKGEVLSDSDVLRDELAALNDHNDRPEVMEARGEGRGASRRFSDTLQQEMLYAAVPLPVAEGQGVVRVALPSPEVDLVILQLRGLIAFAVLVGLLVAMGVGLVLWNRASRNLRELVHKARALASGTAASGERIELGSGDLTGLAGSINRMADDLEQQVGALGEERARLEAVLEGMGDGVLALDPTGKITMSNRLVRDLLEGSDLGVGNKLDKGLNLPKKGRVQKLAARAARGKAGSAEVKVKTRSRGKRVVQVQATPQRIPGHCVLTFRDVTEIRGLDAVRRDFVANVSHELRTPISIISANAETLLDAKTTDPEQARHFLEVIEGNAGRMSSLVADLLDLARLEAGAYLLEPRHMELAEPVGKLLDLMDSRARDRGVCIDVELEDDLKAWADPGGLEHALVNLVENAIKYTPKGGMVGVHGRLDGDRVRIEVWDTGPGIASEHRARLFERFYRVDPGRSREQGGTGLGLSIVKHLVNAMDGDVGMEPRSEGGSIFYIELGLREEALGGV